MVAGRLQHSWGQDQNTPLINHLGGNTLNQQCLPASRMVARNHKPFFFGPNIDLVTHPDAPESPHHDEDFCCGSCGFISACAPGSGSLAIFAAIRRASSLVKNGWRLLNKKQAY